MKRYKAWILDFDGTLTRQTPLRIFMALWLVGYYLIHPKRLNEIFVLRDWRRLRENLFAAEEENYRERQLSELSRRHDMPKSSLEKILHAWMIERPLKILRFCVRKKLLDAAKNYQRLGVKMIVYSDNPVKEKLWAINFFPDESFSSDDEQIRCMKPDSRGLKKILALTNLKPDEVLYIGDRDDRDGICARRAGVEYLDVKDLEKVTL
ncbi:MAG: HAD family hydrolase [Selenomonadaceae bacterium]|nr:HAD family hydrolase [Selenomonadaceae bacterium]MBQ3726692.1 HAD family hydrolase [Selenomonadaceae bacterium]